MQTVNVHPPVQVTGRHVSVTEPMKDYAVGKIEGLHLDYPKIIGAQVILDVNKHRHHAEVILFCANHITIEASSETDDMYASIDGVMAKIAQQMRKYKTRILKNHRPRNHDGFHFDDHTISLNGFAEDHEVEPEVVQTEKYPVKPMFVDEAMLQMEMSSRDFVVFLNAKTEKVNVLYRRKGGANFGLIEPVFS